YGIGTGGIDSPGHPHARPQTQRSEPLDGGAGTREAGRGGRTNSVRMPDTRIRQSLPILCFCTRVQVFPVFLNSLIPVRRAPGGPEGVPMMIRRQLLAVLLLSLASLVEPVKECDAAMLDLNRAVVVSPADCSGPEKQAVAMLIDEVAKRTRQ